MILIGESGNAGKQADASLCTPSPTRGFAHAARPRPRVDSPRPIARSLHLAARTHSTHCGQLHGGRAPPSACRGRLHHVNSPRRPCHVALKTCVANICSRCFTCFKGTLQVFRMDVANVAMAIHVCFKSLFKMFNPFQTYVANVLSRCCICWKWLCSK